ncbi:MAG: ferric reductase-like transmembrane domain-containing protein [Pseudomonadota bacterium]
MKSAVVWAILGAALLIPLVLAAGSPLLQYRQPIYIAAGLAGVAAMGLLLLQPLLALGALPGLPPRQSRRLHRATGLALVMLILAHVAGLWVTSPPDVIDALTFASPTPFSNWGVIAMWAAFAAAALAAQRRRLRPKIWRRAHLALAATVAAGTAAHALLIDGTMETASKLALAALVLVATALTVLAKAR